MIYRGIGGSWWPDTPLLDNLITERLHRKGFKGSRVEPVGLFGSRSKKQALEYAKHESDDNLVVVTPLPGSVVSWVPGVRDLVLRFEGHLNDLRCAGSTHFQGQSFQALLNDVGGDVSLIETYLSFNRQKRAVSALIDSLLNCISVQEHVIAPHDEIDALLDNHDGELWVTGPSKIEKYDPKIHPEDGVVPGLPRF